MNMLANSESIHGNVSNSALLSAESCQTAVLGVSGYAGGELARILMQHPKLALKSPSFFGRSAGVDDGKQITIADLHPILSVNNAKPSRDPVVPFSWNAIEEAGIELLFLATPHEQSRELVPLALERGIKVVDLSGAWRLKNDANRHVYNLTDKNPQLAFEIQENAVYGCPELHRDKIRAARLVANPGCYATSIILALAPLIQSGLVDMDRGIVCDAKSGVSGAGKVPTAKTHFMYAADNFSAYNIFGHRHTGELLEQLNLVTGQIQFTPHLLPIPRGILSTIYLRLTKKMLGFDINSVMRDFYKPSPMVRIRDTPQLPQIQHVLRTNYCDIGFELGEDGQTLILISCLDNLLKGAAGQAVQNMNVMYGWDETEGLL